MTLPPQWYDIQNKKILFPKDVKAGGTWIAQSEENHVACLLNGAFKTHIKKDFYTQSRGQVLLNILKSGNPADNWNSIDLNGVEPFTLLSIRQQGFFEFRWDETRKYLKEIDPSNSHIWSSATLYEEPVVKEREEWFAHWLRNGMLQNENQILDFHTAKHTEDPHKNVVLKRPDGIETVSITQIINKPKSSQMIYKDFVSEIEKEIFLPDFLTD